VISQVPAVGEVVVYDSLADIQGQSFDTPVVVLAQRLGGTEDIPQGVTAVLTESSTDVLSHVAIRARSQRVLLATCDDDGEWQKLVGMKVSGGDSITPIRLGARDWCKGKVSSEESG
jgi:alpha-glucan,water dikinase